MPWWRMPLVGDAAAPGSLQRRPACTYRPSTGRRLRPGPASEREGSDGRGPGPEAKTNRVRQSRAHVLVDLPTGLPRVLAGRRRVVQVLNNLFGNAARHAPKLFPIRIAVASENGHVAVSVSYEGRGVVLELPHVSQGVGGGEQGMAAGHGLGLAICKRLVEAHGDRIRAESSGAGHGTTITFTLPVDEAPGRAEVVDAAGPGTGRAAAHSGRGRRPADAALRPRRALGDLLRPARDGCVAQPHAHPSDRAAALGAARPDAGRD